MSQSPGHRQWPGHRVHEEPVPERMQARVGGEILADSTDVIRLEEDGYPPRYYFPREDVRLNALQSTGTTTECPFKGTASYFNVNVRVDGEQIEDGAWTYEEPYDEHEGIRGRVAFHDDTMPQIKVRGA